MASHKNFSNTDIQEMAHLWNSGMTSRQIGPIFNTSGQTVIYQLKKIGLEIKDRRIRVLSEKEEDEIKSLYLSGFPMNKISVLLNIPQRNISSVLLKSNVSLRDRSEARREYKVDHLYFSSIETDQQAYWLGFFAADGCISPPHRIRLCLCRKDRSHVESFRQAVGAENPILPWNRKEKEPRSFGIEFYSHQMALDLSKYSITPKKSLRLSWPDLPSYLQAPFSRGYVDGDGSWSIRKDGQIIFTVCGNLSFLEIFQELLIKECAVNKTKIFPTGKTKKPYVLAYGGNVQTPRIASFLYSNATICLDRKRDIALKIVSK